MKRNLGATDRIIRVIVGLGILSLLFFIRGNAKYFGLIGIIPLLTAAFGYCPSYALLGISTEKVK